MLVALRPLFTRPKTQSSKLPLYLQDREETTKRREQPLKLCNKKVDCIYTSTKPRFYVHARDKEPIDAFCYVHHKTGHVDPERE